MDPREKNKKAQVKQKQRVAKQKQKDVVTEKIVKATPEQLKAKLSKRNEDYLFRLHKVLIADGKSDADANEMIDGILQEVIDSQIKGVPAKQMYGTIRTKADSLEHKKANKDAQDVDFWKLCVDNTLLFLSLFAVMYGIVGFTTKNPSKNNQSGILTIILVSVLWGVLITWFTQKMESARKKHQSWWKVIGILVLGLILMYLVLGGTMILPAVINPILPPIWYIILAAVAFGGRWYFRKHYDIKVNSFTRRK